MGTIQEAIITMDAVCEKQRGHIAPRRWAALEDMFIHITSNNGLTPYRLAFLKAHYYFQVRYFPNAENDAGFKAFFQKQVARALCGAEKDAS